jgi:very-short-patch-repair endonuclease
VDEFTPEQLMFTLGVATSADVPEHLRSHLTEPAIARLRYEANTYSNANVVRATLYTSRLDNLHDTTFLAEIAVARRETLTSDELGILHSAGKNQLPTTQFICHAVIEELAERLYHRPDSINSREIFEAMEFQARAGNAHQSFIDGFVKEVPERIQAWSSHDCHNMLRCLAVLSVRHEQSTSLLTNRIALEIDNHPWHDRSVSTWSLARLNTAHPALFSAITERLPRLSNEPHTAQDLATLAWSFAVIEKESAAPAIGLLSVHFEAKRPDPQEIRQMYHACLAVGLQQPGSHPREVCDIAEQEVNASERNLFEYDVLSHLQKIVSASAYKLDATVEGLCPDFVIETDTRRIILECDGTQYHHLSDGTPKGNDVIQDVIMKRAGYEVVHLTDTEWFQRSKDAKTDYLRNLLGL